MNRFLKLSIGSLYQLQQSSGLNECNLTFSSSAVSVESLMFERRSVDFDLLILSPISSVSALSIPLFAVCTSHLSIGTAGCHLAF